MRAPAHAVEPGARLADRLGGLADLAVELAVAAAEAVDFRLDDLPLLGRRGDLSEAGEPSGSNQEGRAVPSRSYIGPAGAFSPEIGSRA